MMHAPRQIEFVTFARIGIRGRGPKSCTPLRIAVDLQHPRKQSCSIA